MDDDEFTASDLQLVKAAFKRLDSHSKKVVLDKFSEVGSVLAPAYQKLLSEVLGPYMEAAEAVKEVKDYFVDVIDSLGYAMRCPLQQLTDKTAVVLVNDSCVNFNRFTGVARSKDVKDVLDMGSLKGFNENKTVIKPVMSREDFIKKFKDYESSKC